MTAESGREFTEYIEAGIPICYWIALGLAGFGCLASMYAEYHDMGFWTAVPEFALVLVAAIVGAALLIGLLALVIGLVGYLATDFADDVRELLQ